MNNPATSIRPIGLQLRYRRIPSSSSPKVPVLVSEKGVLYPSLYLERLRVITQKTKDPTEKKLIKDAFSLAWQAHNGVFRKDGITPYIEHPLKVTEILLSWKVRAEILAAGICHDVREDGKINGQRIESNLISEILNPSIAKLVEGVTELGKEPNYKGEKPTEIEIYRKLLDHGKEDPAILIIKLADRLHNMRTLAYMKPETRIYKAWETLYFYVPIADILGMWQVKRELEDLCFKYLPEEFKYTYEEVLAKRQSVLESTRQQIEETVNILKENFAVREIKAQIIIENRSIFEIYDRMQKRGVASLEELAPYDVWRINIIVSNEQNCYIAQGIVHGSYPPIQEEIRDFIGAPRPNGHQFLHTYVEIPELGRILVQIRSKKMQIKYHFGVAPEIGKENISWMELLLDFLEAHENPEVQSLYNTMANASTPITIKSHFGESRQFPYGATALDFARWVGEGCFLQAVSAKINSRTQPLTTRLKDGDSVLIITDENAHPSLEWIDYLHTQEAITTLQGYLFQQPEETRQAGTMDYLSRRTLRYHCPFPSLAKLSYFISFLNKHYGTLEQFIQDTGLGLLPMNNGLLEDFFNTHASAVHSYTGKTDSYSLFLTAKNQVGVLNRITGAISNLNINLERGGFETSQEQGSIFLINSIIPGDIGSLQRLQIEEIIRGIPGVIESVLTGPVIIENK